MAENARRDVSIYPGNRSYWQYAGRPKLLLGGAPRAAAAAGAEATRDMVARVGRARYQGERSLGHVDAGAASIALLFRVLADG